jgi:DNA-directed RNA polymerase subunit RPC12/RpoP
VAKATTAILQPDTGTPRPSTFQIEHQCPQCGAPACLEETDRLYACPYCRVKSFLLTPEVFRYVLPARTHSADLIHVPYWRFKGILLYSLASGNDHKFVDVSQCAAAVAGVPQTLGVRAQAMKLRFATSECPGGFLPPNASFAATFKDVQRRFSRMLDTPALCQAHLGESVGLLYAPYYVAGGRLYDAVLDAPVAPLPRAIAPESFKGGKPDWKPSFIAALCPDCGWDLEGERDALVLLCRNCSSAWTPSSDRLTRVESDRLSDPDADALYLPFWQIRCDVDGIALRSGADLARIANLAPLRDGSDDFVFWAPAFKVRPQVYLRLAEGLTIGQHQGKLSSGLPPARHHPATLPVEEACQSLKIVLAGFYKPRRALPEVLPGLILRATHFRLAYLPFHPDVHDYVDSLTGLAVGRNLLALSRNL